MTARYKAGTLYKKLSKGCTRDDMTTSFPLYWSASRVEEQCCMLHAKVYNDNWSELKRFFSYTTLTHPSA